MKCLICEQESHKKFDLPVNKYSGGPICQVDSIDSALRALGVIQKIL
jgi:hypothetical protein